MPDDPQREILAILRSLANQPGILWCGLLERPPSRFTCVHADGTPRQPNPAESVLIEAIMTASGALSERLGLGAARDFEHRFSTGGLIIHAPESSRCLILCHAQDANVALLRLSLRDASCRLPQPDLNSALNTFSFPGQADLSHFPDFSVHPVPPPSPQSEVYNPFSSA